MKKLILGTVQFGLNYGINNQLGQPPVTEVFEILAYANKMGITCLDTAEDYGVAPRLIGDFHSQYTEDRRFKVISKISHNYKKQEFVSEHLKDSLDILQVSSLEGYLFHNFSMYKSSPELLDELTTLKYKGLLQKVGVSIYTNEELLEIIKDDRCDIIQLPMNLLDNSFQKGELLQKAKFAGKEIHVRSVYLQGLFFMSAEAIPGNLYQLKPYLHQIRSLADEASINLASLALQYIYNNPLVDKVLIGVDSLEHLSNNIDALNSPMDSMVFNEVNKIKVKETWLLNPVNWK
ncbi:aldo/keto reductase [Chitinophaga arvensicola]|uniref:Predicted oxidoreductase n=1 Tax=Chitinophaga arvensicola TaxID=29529 RepID=A0A1I0NQ07_9BACT|nr:aldo/keto reductase [Chitinophaga arvensicola]SEW03498.1 Predicted oxidoreductase [Chitinophaga arvensicola]